jgi:general secretion pathway protein M
MISAANLPHGLPGRFLALVLTFAVIFAAYGLVVAPLLSLYSDRSLLLANRTSLRDKIAAAAAELPQMRARANVLSGTSDVQQTTLEGSSDPVAMANLQNRVEELAAWAGASISSTETLQPEARDYYRRIGLRVVLNGSFPSLVTFFSGLETSTTPVVVDNLQLHNVQSRTGSNQVSRLDATVDVYGFRVNEQSSGTRP